MTGLGTGFLVRTRLGYADTDLFAVPALLAVALSMYAWLCRTGDRSGAATDIRWSFLLVTVIALAGYLYPSARLVILATLGVAAVAAWPVWQRPRAVVDLALPAAVAVLGIPGWLVAVVLLVSYSFWWQKLLSLPRAALWSATGLVAALILVASSPVMIALWWDLNQYLFQPVAQQSGEMRAIAEAGGVGLQELGIRLGSSVWLALAGALGWIWLLWRDRAFVVFLPLLAMAVLAPWLGVRFTVYGPVLVAIGLGAVVAALRRLDRREHIAKLASLVFACAIFGVAYTQIEQLEARPILSPAHARVLAEAGALATGVVWHWWDYGYAAEHFTGLPAYATGNTASRARRAGLARLYGTGLDEPLSGPEKGDLIVVSWELIRRLEWVGVWNGMHARQADLIELNSSMRLDQGRGVVALQGRTYPLGSIDVVGEQAPFHASWPREDGWHAIINNATGQGYLLPGALYETRAVQWFLGRVPPGRGDVMPIAVAPGQARVFIVTQSDAP